MFYKKVRETNLHVHMKNISQVSWNMDSFKKIMASVKLHNRENITRLYIADSFLAEIIKILELSMVWEVFPIVPEEK